MRHQRWGQILPGETGAAFAAAEAGRLTAGMVHLGVAGLPGVAQYADAHEFDRRAIATFLTSPQRPAKPADLARLYAVRHPDLDATVTDARRDLINHWQTPIETRFIAHARNTAVPLAGRYVDARGYDCQVLVDIAEHLDEALDGTSLEAVAGLVDRPSRWEQNAHRDDALDKTIPCLHARLTAAEITTALRTGTWPDPQALAVMAALAV